MPKVATIGHFSIYMYIRPSEHPPPHVHAMAGDVEVVVRLNCPDGPVEIARSIHLSKAVRRDLLGGLNERVHELCAAWSEFNEGG